MTRSNVRLASQNQKSEIRVSRMHDKILKCFVFAVSIVH